MALAAGVARAVVQGKLLRSRARRPIQGRLGRDPSVVAGRGWKGSKGGSGKGDNNGTWARRLIQERFAREPLAKIEVQGQRKRWKGGREEGREGAKGRKGRK